jgi:hypothetical protein
VGVGGLGVAGLAPSPAVGFEAELDVRRSRYSLGLAAEATSIAGGSVDTSGTVQSAFFGGALMPCVHLKWFGLCGRLAAGAEVSSASELTQEKGTQTSPYLAVGARVLAEIPISSILLVRPQVTVEAPILQTALLVGTTQVAWQTPPIAGSVGLQVAARLP